MSTSFTEHVSELTDRIEHAAAVSGRTGGDVTIVAAAKYLDVATVATLVDSGITAIAENRLQTLVDAQASPELADRTEIDWHFIGRLQSREVPALCERVSWLHALQSESAVKRLVRAADDGVELPRLLVQVNTARDPAKDGLMPEAVDAFLEGLPPQLQVDGFMTMPAFAESAEGSRAAFAELRELGAASRVRWHGRHPLRHLSMGTSQDFDVAVEEGATLVRLGRVLYAPLTERS